MDKVVEAVEKAKKDWEESYSTTKETIKSIQEFGKSQPDTGEHKKNSLPRLNGLAQDGLSLLSSLQFNLDLLAPQLPTDDQVQVAQSLVESWKQQIQSLRLNLRNANLQAKANLRKAAQQEKLHYLLVGGKPHATAIKLSEKGEVLKVLEDGEGKSLSFICEVEERNGKLWIGSVLLPFDWHLQFELKMYSIIRFTTVFPSLC